MKIIYKRQFSRVISNIFAVYVLFVNCFEHVISLVRKPPENGLCLEVYPVYQEDSESRINLL